MRPITGAA